MNKIEELIQQYCPDGVEFKELKEIAEIGTGSSNGNESTEDGQYPLFVRSKFIKKIDSFEFDEEAIIIPGEGGIGDIFHYINGKYALHQRAYRIHLLINYVTTKFIYYYMIANFKEFILQKAVNATVSSIRKPMIEKFQIPIPPLPIQQEIVKILDSFTQLEAELEAELEARRAQYEYYRNRLLSATELNGKWLMNGVEVEWKTLGEICKVSSGGTPSTNEKLYWENGTIPWLKSEVCKDCYLSSSKTFITELGLSNSSAKYLEIGTVLMAMVGATIFKAAYLNFRATTNQNIAGIKSIDTDKLSDKYIFYYILNSYNFLTSKLSGYNMINLSQIKSIQIPILPIEEQNRIVGILDKFDSLVNDISVGLPAEIDGRRKQYNYYRGKLLTFKQS